MTERKNDKAQLRSLKGCIRNISRLLKSVVNYETIAYLIAGVLTTIVDFSVFALVNEPLKASGMDETSSVMLAQLISWVSAVAFAYITNKLLVFKNHDFSAGHMLREASAFVAARIFSGLLVMALMWLMVDLMDTNEYAAKLFTTIINVVFNYVASKLFIFTKK